MAVDGVKVAEALASALSVIPGVRVHSFAPDTFLPPGIVLQQPTMTWDSTTRTFCAINWGFPAAVAVIRNTEAQAQAELFRIVGAIAEVLGEDPTIGGAAEFSRILSATPQAFNSQGTEYPGYLVNIECVA